MEYTTTALKLALLPHKRSTDEQQQQKNRFQCHHLSFLSCAVPVFCCAHIYGISKTIHLFFFFFISKADFVHGYMAVTAQTITASVQVCVSWGLCVSHSISFDCASRIVRIDYAVRSNGNVIFAVFRSKS